MEFLVLERRSGQEIVIRPRNVHGSAAYCRASAFGWISEVRRGNEELRNEGRLGRRCRHETDVAIRQIRQQGPNASLRINPETLSISPDMIRMHILQIGYTLNVLRWIPTRWLVS
jgi:hypothetical protein